jgi:hypothetical protein
MLRPVMFIPLTWAVMLIDKQRGWVNHKLARSGLDLDTATELVKNYNSPPFCNNVKAIVVFDSDKVNEIE